MENRILTLWKKNGRRGELAGLLLIVTLSLVFGFWQLDKIPPGLHYDEAFNELYALRIHRGEIYPIYIPENNGEEPLHIYLTALLFGLIGPTVIGGRMVSAASGVVTGIFTYLLGVELFNHLGRKDAGRIGLLAGLFRAVWYWPIHYNRVGMEPSMVPAVAAMAVYFVWRAIRTARKRDAVFAGAFTALGLYTYPAGRAVPIVVALVMAYHLFLVRDFNRRVARNFGIAAVVAFIALLPLGLYFVQNPDWILLRMRQTTLPTLGSESPFAAVQTGLKNTLLGFFWRGDENWRQNLPGRPAFDPAQFVIVLVGFAACARRMKISPYWYLLIWAGVGLLPTILTEYSPHFGRALGATVPLSLIGGLGLWTVSRQIAKRWPTSGLPPSLRSALAAGFVGITIAYSGGLTLNDYFNRWARSPELFIAFDEGLRAIGEYAAQLPADEPVYLSPVPSDWYTLTYALNDDSSRLRSYNGRECLVFPARTDFATHEIVIGWPNEDERSLERLRTLFPGGAVSWQVSNREQVYAVDYTIPPGQTALISPRYALQADFADKIALLGYDQDSASVASGGVLALRVWWQALNKMTVDYTVFIHLISKSSADAEPILWSQHDGQPCDNSYSNSRWSPGEVVWDDYRLELPDNMPPGDYTLELGMYDLISNQRLEILSADEPIKANALKLAAVRVETP